MIKITPEIEELYLSKMADLLVNGEVINHVVNTSQLITLRDADGEVINTSTKQTETRKTTILPCPPHIYAMIERSMSIDCAVETLARAGYLVIDPSVTKTGDEAPKGLSDYAVNEIKAKLLGIEN